MNAQTLLHSCAPLSSIGSNLLASAYESDAQIQRILTLLQLPDRSKIHRFTVNILYMDNRLVIPKLPRPPMLSAVSSIWWPYLHRELARECPECQNAGKNIKVLQSQKSFGKTVRQMVGIISEITITDW